MSDRRDRLGHLQEIQKMRADEQAYGQDDQAEDNADLEAESDVSLRSALKSRSKRLADCSDAPVGDCRGDNHEEEEHLVDHAHGCLDFPAQTPGNEHVDEADQEMEDHHQHLRPGEGPDILGAVTAAGLS
jgi:hypothetical protein